VANARAHDPVRHEAYLLSKLQSIYAWRGLLVDYVISRWVVHALKNGWSITLGKALDYAKTTFQKQLAFAKQHRLREPGMKPSKADDAFAAFYAVEYGLGVSEEQISQAWSEIELALTNLFAMPDLLALLGQADNLIAQRALTFSCNQTTVRAVPDLIAFWRDDPPLIIDWKVHAFATHDYRLQLACYAIALTRCKPHRDFPPSLFHYSAADIRLLEVQLLGNKQRKYALSDDDVENTDTRIAETAMQMVLAVGNKKKKHLRPIDFPVTTYPEVCQRCSFRSLCWKESE